MKNMKKGIIYFFAVVFASALFAGCGSNNPDEPAVTDYAKEIAGTYPGQLNVTVQGNVELPQQDNQVTLTHNGENKINLKLNGFTLTVPVSESASSGLRVVPTEEVVIGDVVVEGITVVKSGNDVVLSEKTVEVVIVKNGVTTKPTVTVSQGKVNGSNLGMKITIPMEEYGNAVVAFTGTKK